MTPIDDDDLPDADETAEEVDADAAPTEEYAHSDLGLPEEDAEPDLDLSASATEPDADLSASATEPDFGLGGDDLDLGAAAEEEVSEGEAPPADEDEFEEEGEPEPLPAKVSLLTVALCVLNVMAALGFAFLLLLDYEKRQAWSYAVFRHDLVMWGLPLEEEDSKVSASQETRRPQRLDPEQIAREFAGRKPGKSASEKFQAVQEVVGQRITPDQLSPDTLNDLFKDVGGEPVRTLEEEVRRVDAKLFTDLEKAAAETAENAKTEVDKRKQLTVLLLPLTYNPHQIDDVDRKIKAAAPAKLDEMLLDAAQRRMLWTILVPLELRRPWDVQKEAAADQPLPLTHSTLLENCADPDVTKLDDLKKLLKDCLAGAQDPKLWPTLQRESYEKRRSIAYLLLTVNRVRKPDGQLLYPKGAERTEVVVGLWEYAQATDALTLALQKSQDRLMDTVQVGREGWSFEDDAGRTLKIEEFVGQHEAQIKKILDLMGQINNRENRLAWMKQRETEVQKTLDERKLFYDGIVTQLIKSRAETAIRVAELRKLEDELFHAQRVLADAAETNQRLEAEMRKMEQTAKGGRP